MANSLHKEINIVQLYPDKMNIYGDNGNAQIIYCRSKLYGYKPILNHYNSVDDLAKLIEADIVLGGGGQDSGQRAIIDDLQKVHHDLVGLVNNGLPALVICGLYQLFGNYFKTSLGDELPGLGIFNMATIASNKRLIGNVYIDTDKFGELIGYENHSGLTTLLGDAIPLGKVISGYGNDGQSGYEGAMFNNAVGTYLHGPVLSKNPVLADWLIKQAVGRRYGDDELIPANETAKRQLAKLDNYITQARSIAKSRPQ